LKTSVVLAVPCFRRLRTDWSSRKFSRRSTDQTCQSGSVFTIVRARGWKYPPPAEVPGLRTRTFLAFGSPIFSTPTTFRLSGVPGEAKPRITLNLTGILAPAAGANAAHSAATASAISPSRTGFLCPALIRFSSRPLPGITETCTLKCIGATASATGCEYPRNFDVGEGF
jgi:hypothetical protein